MAKVCSKCKVEKPEHEFFKTGKQRGKQYYRGDCKTCAQAYQRAKTKGLTHEEREEFLALRNFKCEICGMSRTASQLVLHKDLSVDHCHITGANKGVLCNVCNIGSGFFKDNPILTNKLCKYLERTRIA